MPRGHLNESYVQRVAVEWLADYCRQRLSAKAILPAMEVRVSSRSTLGYGRADGLVIAQLSDESIFTASLEAKSSRTWGDVRISNRDLKWFTHSLVIAVLVGVASASVGSSVGEGWFWDFVFPILMFFGAGFIFAAIAYERRPYQQIRVVEQAKRYPANEQWIALSADVINWIGGERKFADFNYYCKRQGLGLIRISQGNRVTLVLPPKQRKKHKKLEDFLACYARANEIRKSLALMQSQSVTVVEPILLDESEHSIQDQNSRI